MQTANFSGINANASSNGGESTSNPHLMMDQQQPEMVQLQQFVQGQLSLAISAEDGQQQQLRLDGQFPSKCNGIDAALFSPSQQSRGGGGGDEASEEIGQIAHNSGTNESAAKLLASAFLLDQQQQATTTKGGHSKNNVMATIISQQNSSSPSSSPTPLNGQQNGNRSEGEKPTEGIDGNKSVTGEEASDAKNVENDQKEMGRDEEGVMMNGKCEDGDEINNVGQQEEQQQDRRTSDLIRKQLTEIEKEIARRMQNKNVKKMDEQEMSQLLLNHGLMATGLRTVNELNGDDQKSALPFSANNSPNKTMLPPTGPSLDQLRQNVAISTPSSQQQMPQPVPFPTASGFFPQQTFGPFPMQFSHIPSTDQFVQPQFALAQHHHPHQMPFAFPSPYSAPFLPQQSHQTQQVASSANMASAASQSPSPPMLAQMLPPNLSAITPEMAAALLAQLQQHNPGLLQSFVAQQQSAGGAGGLQNRISATAGPINGNGIGNECGTNLASANTTPIPNPLPAPPKAKSGVAIGVKRQQRRASISGGNGRKGGDVDGIIGKNGENGEGTEKIGHRQNSADWAEEGGQNASSIAGGGQQIGNGTMVAGTTDQPVWVMRESYLKRREREEQRRREQQSGIDGQKVGPMLDGEEANEEEEETDRLLLADAIGNKIGTGGQKVTSAGIIGEQQQPQQRNSLDQMDENGTGNCGDGDNQSQGKVSRKGSKKEVIIHEPAVLIEGVLFRARYLGSTQMTLDGRPTKSSRMAQAQEAVARVKAPEGEPQPSTEIDLFISTEKIMVLNTDLQRISETDVRQDILMDHSLRSISYIADIGDLVVLMARRVPNQQEQQQQTEESDSVRKAPRVICHVFESDEANFIAQSIGQAFQVAYVEFLRANGIEDPNYLRDIDYQEVLNSQEMMAEELELLARKETQKDVVVTKRSGEALGVVIVESGWGSMLPTSVIANMAPGGAAARSNQLNIGDQIIGINGISLVGLPLSAAQQNIKNARSSTAVRLTIVSTPPVVEVRIRRPDTKYQLGFSVQNGVICSLLRGGIAERGGIRVGHRIIEINHQSVVAIPHERIVNMLATATGEIHMKTMPTSMFRLLTGQEVPNYI